VEDVVASTAKMSCFATLLSGMRKKHRKVADATKVGCNECPKVKPVDAPVAADTVPPVAEAHKGGDQLGEKAPMKCELESHAAKKSVWSHDASARLKRSCSNIETKRRGPLADATPARSLSHGDLTRGPPEEKASPASAKTSRSADRITLKRRSSSQVLPSCSRNLWRRLFLWSYRDRHGGYASDTHEAEVREVVVVDDGSPPPNANQWVAFCADSNSSLLDRVGAWVSSIENEPFHIPDDADTAPPRVFEVGEPSSGKGRLGGKYKRGAAADEVVQPNSAAFSSVAHMSGMGLKAMPVLVPFSSLRAVNLSGNFIGEQNLSFRGAGVDVTVVGRTSRCEFGFGFGFASCSSYRPGVAAQGPALTRSVQEQDWNRRGSPEPDEAARAQPQLQPHFAHRARYVSSEH
jgi:hypothetical protein